jgi:uncharacterized membrane protein
MTERTLSVCLAIGALSSGLVAGTFFAFSTFVMRALDRLPSAQAIAAMQAVNVPAAFEPCVAKTYELSLGSSFI